MTTARMTDIRTRLAELKKITETTGAEQAMLYGELSVMRRQMEMEADLAGFDEVCSAKETLEVEEKVTEDPLTKMALELMTWSAIKVAKLAAKEATNAASAANHHAARAAALRNKAFAQALQTANKAEKIRASLDGGVVGLSTNVSTSRPSFSRSASISSLT